VIVQSHPFAKNAKGWGNSYFVKPMESIPGPQMRGTHSTSLRAGSGHPTIYGTIEELVEKVFLDIRMKNPWLKPH
jgi:hypothetical protein